MHLFPFTQANALFPFSALALYIPSTLSLALLKHSLQIQFGEPVSLRLLGLQHWIPLVLGLQHWIPLSSGVTGIQLQLTLATSLSAALAGSITSDLCPTVLQHSRNPCHLAYYSVSLSALSPLHNFQHPQTTAAPRLRARRPH
jgi:hypothetical protein